METATGLLMYAAINKKSSEFISKLPIGSKIGDLTVTAGKPDIYLGWCMGFTDGGLGCFYTQCDFTEEELKILWFKENRVAVPCLCSCGKTVYIRLNNLLDGTKKSCLKGYAGKHEHGHKEKRLAAKLLREKEDGLKKLKAQEVKKQFRDIPKSYWTSIVNGATSRQLEFSITPEYAWSVWEKQAGFCTMTGTPLSFKQPKQCEAWASLDRIDSSKGYVEGNIQWVDREINMLMSNLPKDKFVVLCTRVTSHKIKNTSDSVDNETVQAMLLHDNKPSPSN